MFHAPIKADTKQANGSFIKSKVIFEKHVTKLFKSGRIFANYRQLDQYLTMFLESWSILKNRDGMAFRCSYAPINRTYPIKDGKKIVIY